MQTCSYKEADMFFPTWVTDLPEGSKARAQAEIKFTVNLAALYASESCQVKALCEVTGFTQQAYYHAQKQGDCSGAMAYGLESIAGRKVIQKELICSKFRNK